MEARSFPYDRGKTDWAAAAAAVRFATRQEEAETAVLRTLGSLDLTPRSSHQLATEYRLMPAPGATKCLWWMAGRLD